MAQGRGLPGLAIAGPNPHAAAYFDRVGERGKAVLRVIQGEDGRAAGGKTSSHNNKFRELWAPPWGAACQCMYLLSIE